MSSTKCYGSIDSLLVNIEEYLKGANPLLLSFLFSATSTVREMKTLEEGSSKHFNALRIYVIVKPHHE